MIFDVFVISITLILAIKGFFNGLIKEMAGLIGIIGGFFIASRYYHQAGEFINTNLINIPNKSAIDLVGFVGVFLLVWIFCIFFGFLFSNLLKLSALGFLDKLLGFIVGGIKFFLIISVIIASLYHMDFLKEYMQKLEEKSIVLPISIKIGEEIMKFSPQNISELKNNLEEKVKENLKNIGKVNENLDKN